MLKKKKIHQFRLRTILTSLTNTRVGIYELYSLFPFRVWIHFGILIYTEINFPHFLTTDSEISRPRLLFLYVYEKWLMICH